LVFSYGSNNVAGPREGTYSTLFTGLFVVGLGAGYLLGRRRDGLVEGVLLLLIVTLVTNKVFSPQYILWARATHRGLLRGSTVALAGRGHPCIFHLGRRGTALCGGPVTDATGRGAIPLAVIRGTGAGLPRHTMLARGQLCAEEPYTFGKEEPCAGRDRGT